MWLQVNHHLNEELSTEKQKLNFMPENLLGRKADTEKSRARVQDLERRLGENRFTYFFSVPKV